MRYRTPILVLLAFVAWIAIFFFYAHPRLVQWGSTQEEQARVLPGDELVPGAVRQGTRAMTVQAPPEKVWPWLMQIGIGRSGFYSYTWLENLFFSGIHNDFILSPERQYPQGGEFVRSFQFGAETPGMNGWKMEPFKAGEYFYLDPGWGPFVVEPDGKGGTRFLIRSRRGPVSTIANVLLDFLFDPLHGTMEKRTMVSVKALAEGRRPFSPAWTVVATLGFLAAALLSSGAIVAQGRKKWWILLPSVYSLVVFALTRDLKAALVAQVALGTIVAFFIVLGRRAWAYMVFFWIYAFAVLIWAKDAYVVFGLTIILPEFALLQGAGIRKEGP